MQADSIRAERLPSPVPHVVAWSRAVTDGAGGWGRLLQSGADAGADADVGADVGAGGGVATARA